MYLDRGNPVDIYFNVCHVFLKGRVLDNLTQQTVVEMLVFEKLYGIIIKLQHRQVSVGCFSGVRYPKQVIL